MDATESASLDCKRADRSVWLVKVPAFVKAAWTAAAAAPTAATNPPQIGTVRPGARWQLGFRPTPRYGPGYAPVCPTYTHVSCICRPLST
jgi:hypothetical protein